MKKNKTPSAVVLVIFTAVAVVSWITFDIIRTFTKKAVPEDVPPDFLVPLDPTLDQKTIERVQETIYFEKGQVPEKSPQPLESPETSPQP